MYVLTCSMHDRSNRCIVYIIMCVCTYFSCLNQQKTGSSSQMTSLSVLDIGSSSLGPRPKTNPSADCFQYPHYTTSDTHTGLKVWKSVWSAVKHRKELVKVLMCGCSRNYRVYRSDNPSSFTSFLNPTILSREGCTWFPSSVSEPRSPQTLEAFLHLSN